MGKKKRSLEEVYYPIPANFNLEKPNKPPIDSAIIKQTKNTLRVLNSKYLFNINDFHYEPFCLIYKKRKEEDKQIKFFESVERLKLFIKFTIEKLKNYKRNLVDKNINGWYVISWKPIFNFDGNLDASNYLIRCKCGHEIMMKWQSFTKKTKCCRKCSYKKSIM